MSSDTDVMAQAIFWRDNYNARFSLMQIGGLVQLIIVVYNIYFIDHVLYQLGLLQN